MAGFAVEDMALKAAALTVPVWQVMLIFGGGGMIAFAVVARMRGERLAPPAAFERTMLIRDAFEVAGRLFYTLAYVFAPLTLATVILQATPLVVVAGAALVFGETVGWRRWAAVIAGLVGVLIVMRPGTDDFTLPVVFALLGMLGFAGRDLATRAAPPALGPFTLGVYGFAAIVIGGLIFAPIDGRSAVMPDGAASLALAGAVAIGVAAYTALTFAMKTGEITSVAPFRYSRILFGVALGVIVFGETMDTMTLIGSAVVVASGLYIFARGRRLSIRDRAEGPASP